MAILTGFISIYGSISLIRLITKKDKTKLEIRHDSIAVLIALCYILITYTFF